MTRLYGEVILPLGGLDELARAIGRSPVSVEFRESTQYAGGRYLLARVGSAQVSIESTGPGECLLHAEQEDPNLYVLAQALSPALTAGGLRHRIELYEGEVLAKYLHHAWPSSQP